jgi:hypothetical protein
MRLLKNNSPLPRALAVLLAAVFCSSCGVEASFTFETASPNGRYKVKLEGRGEPPSAGLGEFQRQIVTLETTRDGQVVLADGGFFREDNLDVYFLDRYPVREWLSDSVLRFGDVSTKDPFQDRLNVTNRTNKTFDLVILRYGKYEMFFLYDFAPGSEVELNASPQLHRETPAWNAYYQAYVKGVPVTGGASGPERSKENAGPMTLTVDIVDRYR